MQQNPSAPTDSGSSRRSGLVILTGAVLALLVGFADVVISILSEQPPAFASFFTMLLPVLVTTLLIFGFFVTVRALVGLMFRSGRVKPVQTSVTLAVLWGVLFILARVGNLLKTSFTLMDFIKGGLLIGLGVYAVHLILHRTRLLKRIFETPALGRSCVLALIFGLTEGFLFIWLFFYPLGTVGAIVKLVCFLAFLFVLHLTMLWTFRKASTFKLVPIIWGLLILFLVVGPIAYFILHPLDKPAYTDTGKEHTIKNVLLITIDTLRPDFLSCYGTETAYTPAIDALAEEGILFEKAYAPSPWTLPTFASLFCGYPPSVHLTLRADRALPDTLCSLTEALHDDGYYTAAIGRNGMLRRHAGIDQGFDEYDFYPKPFEGTSLGSKIISKIVLPDRFRSDASTEDLTDLAVKWMRENRDKDFFLWLHYFDPHLPYAPPANFIPRMPKPHRMSNDFDYSSLDPLHHAPTQEEIEWIKGLYDGEVRYVDTSFGRFIRALKELKLYEDALIVLTSDHGEEFWEHGGFEHGHTVYNELLWVPMIVKLPAKNTQPQARRVKKRVPIQAIMPTILEMCRIDNDIPDFPVTSLSSLWGSRPQEYEERPIVSSGLMVNEDREAIIFDDDKYVRYLSSDKEELYDLIQDPREYESIVTSSPGVLRRGRSYSEAISTSSVKTKLKYGIIDPQNKALDAETLRIMRSLGYLK